MVDAEVVDEVLHADAQALVTAVDGDQMLGLRPMRGLRTPARMGPMTLSRGVDKAALVRGARGGTW